VAKRNEKLVKLLDAIGDLDLARHFADNTIDAFGDAYEYLMTMYASSAGKSGGEFFTPQEVSELLARITVVGKTEVNKVYDPACGSGSLLLKFAKVLGKDNVRQGFFGQEINLTTYNLCRINMFLHDVNFEKFDIAHGDTLIDPAHWDDEPFEAIVSNPPYSIKWEGDANPLLINDPRFAPAGVLAPKSKADLAFTMHILSWLASTARPRSSSSPACSTAAGPSRRSASTSSTTTTSTPSSSCRPTSSSARRSPPASSCSRSRSRQRGAVHRRLGAVRPQGNKNKLTELTSSRSSTRSYAAPTLDHFARLVDNSDHRRERLQPLGDLVRRGRGHARPSTSSR
jgi:type I restriction enzyme M protein